ncbi:retrovirus-related pol polyprotein from transposon TNT 1-94 [Tanacetum coccineum]
MDLCGPMRVVSINGKSVLCYPTNDNDDLGKLDAKADIGPGLHSMTPTTSSSGLIPNTVSQQPCIPPNRDDWDHLFQPMFDEYFNPPLIVVIPVQDAAAPRAVVLADSPVSTSIDQDAPLTSIPLTQEQEHSPNISQDRTKDHLIANVIGDPSRLVSTRKQLKTKPSGATYMPPNFCRTKRTSNHPMTKPSCIDAMQNKFMNLKDYNYLEYCVQICPDIVMGSCKRMESISEESFNPSKIESILCSSKQSSNKNMMIFQLDVKMAFLNGELKEEVYLSQPEGFVDQEYSSHVYKLKKALYGLIAVDPTLFTWKAGNDLLLVQIYVDDIIFASTNTARCNEFANLMTTKFKMSMMGQISFFLGLQISQSPRDTPIVEKNKLDKYLQGTPVDATLYRGMIGSLMYLTSSRPDLIYAVCLCARYQEKPIEKHLNTTHITRDVRTLDAIHQEALNSRYKLVSWSFPEAKEHWRFRDYGFTFNKIPLYCDNKSAIALCCYNVPHSRAKHIDVHYHFIKEHVENRIVELYFIRTEYQLADIFAKPLPRERFNFSIEKLGMRSISRILNKHNNLLFVMKMGSFAENDSRSLYQSPDRKPAYAQKEETFQVYTIKKVQDTDSYEFLLANKKYIVNAKVFRTILAICLRVEGVDFTDVPEDNTPLTFLIDLGYKGQLNRHTNMFVDHMHQPQRTLAAIINKENVDYSDLIWEDFAYQIDHKKQKRSRQSEPEPEPAKKKTSTEEAEAARKVHATHAMIVNESIPEYVKKKSSGRSSKNVVIQDTPSAPNSKPATSKTKLKGAPSLTPQEQEVADIIQALKESKKTSRRQPGTGGSNKGTGSKPGVPDESTVVSDTLSEGTGAKPGVPDEDKDITEETDDKDGDVDDEGDGDVDDEGDDHVRDTQDADDEDDETKFDEDETYKYKIRVRNEEYVEMKDDEVVESDKGEEMVTDATKEEAEKTLEAIDYTKKTELPPSSSSLFVSSGFGDQFLKLSFDSPLVSIVKDSADIDSQVPTVVDSYLDTKVGDVFHKELQKHTADLIHKYSLQHLPELTKKLTPTAEQESEKSTAPYLLDEYGVLVFRMTLSSTMPASLVKMTGYRGVFSKGSRMHQLITESGDDLSLRSISFLLLISIRSFPYSESREMQGILLLTSYNPRHRLSLQAHSSDISALSFGFVESVACIPTEGGYVAVVSDGLYVRFDSHGYYWGLNWLVGLVVIYYLIRDEIVVVFGFWIAVHYGLKFVGRFILEGGGGGSYGVGEVGQLGFVWSVWGCSNRVMVRMLIAESWLATLEARSVVV